MRILLSLVVILASCVPPSGDMGAPQSPSATPTFPVTITPPVNGENLNATDLNVNVEMPLQNGVEAARLLTYGGGIRRRVLCSSNTVMVIQPLGAVIATVAGVNTVVPWTTGAATINPTTLSGGLAASTRYWVYALAVLSTGIPVFVISTNAPDAGLKYSSATTDQLYVSTFVTDAGASILLFTQTDNVYNYLDFGTGNRILAAGNALGATVVPFGVTVPTGASAAQLRAAWTSTAVTLVRVQTVASDIFVAETSTTGSESIGFFPVSTVNGNQVLYLVGNAAAALTLSVAGFTL